MITIRNYRSSDQKIWDNYVKNHPNGTLYHLSGWKNVIKKTYGHKSYYLMALSSSKNPTNPSNPTDHGNLSNCLVGILPLVHLKHFLFGNSLISMPFFDMAGILADDEKVEKALFSEAIRLGCQLNADTIELRHAEPLPWTTNSSQSSVHRLPAPKGYQLSGLSCTIRTHKVRMLLELPDSSEALIKSFKSKLRSQIRKPIREGFKAKIGGDELVDDFYHVFSINMRDLGSPVHSKKFMQNVLVEFPGRAKIIIVYKKEEAVACSLVVGFRDILENPWASALRKYSRSAPNMLLYWTMLEYACDNGYNYFDFGRSTPGEGTYKFKEQWGAKSKPLHWYYASLNGKSISGVSTEKSRFDRAIYYWQKIPVPVTKIIGPMIRKYIGL